MKIIILLLFLFILSVNCDINNYVLKQVLIISRHNVRTPLSKNLAAMTPKTWPKWKEKSGYLTAKGKLLEGFMGEYFAAWLYVEGLLPPGCPGEDILYVYANTKQRTRASAQAFVDKAFPECNVIIHHKDNNNMDPIFNPVIHNTSDIFKQTVLEEMQETLKSLTLNNSYEDLEAILNYKDSDMCKVDKKCDLVTDKNRIINVKAGEKPNVSGPLKVGNSVVDAFVMEYYEGLPREKVAWGQLENGKQWHTIMNLSRGYHNVIFNTTLVAKDIAEPLIKYLSNIFLSHKETPKITLLMGHDANMYTILNGMRFKPYKLMKQYELTPVGGKIVFQKWFDKEKERDLLKINYVYQTTSQLRNGEELSLENPPEHASLELTDCKVDENGFCLWEDFLRLLKNL